MRKKMIEWKQKKTLLISRNEYKNTIVVKYEELGKEAMCPNK